MQVELARIEHLLDAPGAWLDAPRAPARAASASVAAGREADRARPPDARRRARASCGRLDKLERQRRTRARARQRRGAFTVSLVGYTNAGKSTLFNALTGAGTYAADQLFATLDTLTRRLRLADGAEIVLSDTVGFMRDLPHQLVDAFGRRSRRRPRPTCCCTSSTRPPRP